MRTLIRTNMATNPSMEILSGYGGTANVNLSADWATSGIKSLLITPTGVSVDTFASAGGDTGAMQLGMVAGKTYTISANIYTPEAQVGSLHGGYTRRIALFYRQADLVYRAFSSNQGPVIGTDRVYLTFTIPADSTEAFVRLYNGSNNVNDKVYWDSLLLEEGSLLRDYFSGSTPESADLFNKWTGTPNASTSEQYFIYQPENYSNSGLQEVKMKSLENILGPNPVRPMAGTFNDVRRDGLEKVLSDNGLI